MLGRRAKISSKAPQHVRVDALAGVAADHRRSRVRLAHRADAEVRIEHQEQARRTLEQGPKINLFAAHLPQPP
jgi:hypothetical protein